MKTATLLYNNYYNIGDLRVNSISASARWNRRNGRTSATSPGLYTYFFKHFIDVALSLALLVAASPLLLLALALTMLDGHRNPLFLQRRIGLNGREFTIYKFKTMQSPSPNAPPVDIKPDAPELTPIGRFMRKTGLDELPQLINIIKGDMSLIGPRPYAVRHGQRYANIDSRYYERYRVRPGLACIVEVTKLHYLTDTPGHFKSRINCDLYYINHLSLALDIKIFIKMVRCVLKSLMLELFGTERHFVPAPMKMAPRQVLQLK